MFTSLVFDDLGLKKTLNKNKEEDQHKKIISIILLVQKIDDLNSRFNEITHYSRIG
jgi:hypothetical protein